MTTLVTIPAGETAYTIVAGVSGKIIVVRHIVAAAATSTLSCTFRLKSDSTVLTPWMRTGGNVTYQWDSQRGPIQSAAGAALNGENPLSDGAVVLIVYDLVNA